MRAMLIALLFLPACSSGEELHQRIPAQAVASTQDTPAAGMHLPSRGELLRNTYEVARGVCGYDPQAVYEQAGSSNVHLAAEWFRKSRRRAHIALLLTVAVQMV
jgi:hypothetical protein